jgi:hypothetical protein
MLPNKDGMMVKVPRETRKIKSFKKKENEVMENYIDVGLEIMLFSVQNKSTL